MKPLHSIFVPEAKPAQKYQIHLLNQTYEFKGLKQLLGCADYDKAGERNAGLVATSDAEREAARQIVSNLTLEHLFENPLTDDNGEIDSVMRVNYDIDLKTYEKNKHTTIGELKNTLLKSEGAHIQQIGKALTGVMAAAVAKLCDTHELIYIANKIEKVTKARTTLGLAGQLSSRVQPNHQTDDLRGLTLLAYSGISMGGGDCLIGTNPAIDTVENVSKILHHFDELRRREDLPTQLCVLSHIKTQMACLEQGAPVEIAFQSLAGTEATNLTEFDISVELLDDAYHMMHESGPLKSEGAEQCMYFETGQGSEFTYQKHNGIDMTTAEALCYGLARRYDPFMVNNVTGFIGPETHANNFEMIASCLQDHFMGKLMGLPMGMAPCYTLHSGITLEGQQMATQMLTAAGANFYMDVYLNTDRMLAYFDTSCHDNQTLRELYNKKPAPEYLQWAIARGIYQTTSSNEIIRGPAWGDVRQFFNSEVEFNNLVKHTPSVYSFENAGPRPADQDTREVKYNQAVSRTAMAVELNPRRLGEASDFQVLSTLVDSKASHLNSPDLGADLSELSKRAIEKTEATVQVVISDGLSAEAVHANVPDILPILSDGIKALGYNMDKPILVPYGRVKLSEVIAELTGSDLILMLIGERPGGTAASSRSLSCYMTYQLKDAEVKQAAAQFNGSDDIQFEYSVISNIYDEGLHPLEAASVITEFAKNILDNKAAGNRLQNMLA